MTDVRVCDAAQVRDECRSVVKWTEAVSNKRFKIYTFEPNAVGERFMK